MIILYVLLVMASSVLGNQDLEEVCPLEKCERKYASRFSDKPAINIHSLWWQHGSDLDVVKATPNLENLEVENCASDFKMDVFPPLPALTIIQIANCSISELQKYQFKNLINLDLLNLEENSIEILSNDTFNNLSRLTKLYLGINLIKVLPEGVFHPLESLREVALNENNISVLAKDTFIRNLKLREIGLSGNPLKTISIDVPISTSVNTNIHIQSCGELKELRLSSRLGDLYLLDSGVERLQINGSIWYIVHQNSKVTRADLSGTYFYRSFVEVLCDMPSLEWLNLSNSSKPTYDSYFDLDEDGKECRFSNLRSLNLSGNKLDYIPRRLPLFGPNLTTLDLSNNLLDDRSLELLFVLDTPKGEEGHFPNLSFLHMARNKLKKIPQSFPLVGPNLTILDLSYNLLEDVSGEFLAKAHNLQSLFLEGNRLTSFNYISVFSGLKSLKRLALYDNAFNASFFRNMTKYFGDNGLQLIQKENRTFIEAENQAKEV